MHIFTTACCIIALVEKLQNSNVEKLSPWMMSYDWVGSLSQNENNQRPFVFDTTYQYVCFFSICFPMVVKIIALMPCSKYVCGNMLLPPPLRDTCEQFPNSEPTNHSLSDPLCQQQHKTHTHQKKVLVWPMWKQ